MARTGLAVGRHTLRLDALKFASRSSRDAFLGYVYITPWIIGFTALVFGPMMASLYLSLTDYSLLNSPTFLGFDNYVTAFTADPVFYTSVGNTLYYVGLGVPITVASSLGLAVLLDQGFRGTRFLRTAFFVPSVTPVVAAVLIWRWIFQPDFGLANYVLAQAGLPQPDWLASTSGVKPTLILINMWLQVGGSSMLILLAGLQSIPSDMYEAAEIDGASRLQRFLRITIPLVSPSLFFVLILNLIEAFRVFTLAYVATEGGPGNASLFYVLHLFFRGFRFLEMGYGSALAWILFLVILALTGFQMRLSRRWVHYQG